MTSRGRRSTAGVAAREAPLGRGRLIIRSVANQQKPRRQPAR
jgi:hypothetical protein